MIIFDILLITFFVNRNNVTFFPFRRKNASKKSLSKNYLKWFIDGVTRYLKHTTDGPKMVKNTLKISQQILQSFQRVFDHFVDTRHRVKSALL